MKKKKTTKRGLTQTEQKNIRTKIQSTASMLYRLIENPQINRETKDVIRKMHKCVIDASSYSQRLNFL